MRNLLVITPSRGRPERLRAMLDACLTLSTADADIAVGCDDDDLDGYRELAAGYRGCGRVRWFGGPRTGLGEWTNRLAAHYLRADTGTDSGDDDGDVPRYRAFASLGDDHLPRTRGWDELLLAAIDGMGGTGIAYGDDLFAGQALPTAPVVSADIVQALGWMCEPSLHHMYVDNVWADIGRAAGCLAYVPDAVIEHVHFRAGKTPVDPVYTTAESWTQTDKAAYLRWRERRMRRDVIRVRLLQAMGEMRAAGR
jgi:hypothetical protein